MSESTFNIYKRHLTWSSGGELYEGSVGNMAHQQLGVCPILAVETNLPCVLLHAAT